MVAKIWKKLLLFVVLIACLFNVVIKIVNKNSLEQELQASAQYVQKQEIENKINDMASNTYEWTTEYSTNANRSNAFPCTRRGRLLRH